MAFLGPHSIVPRTIYRLARIVVLALAAWIVINLSQTWGGDGGFAYPQAKWNGRVFVETGRMIVICDWRCYLGLPPPRPRSSRDGSRP